MSRRVSELTRHFSEALAAVGVEPSSPMVMLAVRDASMLKAVAEQARNDYLSKDRSISLGRLLRCERLAASAVARLGIGVPKARLRPTEAVVPSSLAELSDA